MTTLASVILDVPDTAAADAFHAALGLDDRIRVRAAAAPSSGFRAFTLSLVVSQPSTVDALLGSAVEAGATVLKPVGKSFWGYGGVVQAPDGTIWKAATSSKKDTGPATRRIDEIALLLGVADVAATKRFYVDHGFVVGKGFGTKYVEFAGAASGVKLALYGRRALAKDAGVPVEGSGSHRITLVSDGGAFTDPDGFVWESAAVVARSER